VLIQNFKNENFGAKRMQSPSWIDPARAISRSPPRLAQVYRSSSELRSRYSRVHLQPLAMSRPLWRERTTPLPHYPRPPPASTLLPADGGVPRAAAAVAEELGCVLEAHRVGAAEVAACAAWDPPAGAPAADAALRDLLVRTTALLARTVPGTRLAERNRTRAPSAPCVADQVLSCVDRKLDALETRLEVLYGLPRVTVAPETDAKERDASTYIDAVASMPLSAGRGATFLTQHLVTGTPAGTAGMDQTMETPSRQQSTDVSPPAPSTPHLEDFGIDDTALQGLTRPLMYHMGSTREPLAPNAPYEQVVQRSVEALHIQTPVQVATRYGTTPREAASTGLADRIVFPPTPPSVDLPEMLQRPISLHRGGISSVHAVPEPAPRLYPVVAKQSLPQPLPDRRALSFEDDEDEAPADSGPVVDSPAPVQPPPTASALRMTRSRAKRAATEEAVDDRYPKMANYLQNKFPKAAILAACDVLHTLHEKQGLRRSLIIPKDEMPGVFSSITRDGEEVNVLIYTLSKLELVTLRKERKTNEVLYEFGACL
jgi:hypothetical protein